MAVRPLRPEEARRAQHTLLSKLIVERRQELGITQQDIADQVGVTANAVSAWATGRSAPQVRHRAALAAVLRVNVGALNAAAAGRSVTAATHLALLSSVRDAEGPTDEDPVRFTDLQVEAIGAMTEGLRAGYVRDQHWVEAARLLARVLRLPCDSELGV